MALWYIKGPKGKIIKEGRNRARGIGFKLKERI